MAQRYELPVEQDLADLENEISTPAFKGKGRIPELTAGLEVLRAISHRGLIDIPTKTLKVFFGEKNANDILNKIVRNSYSTDVHFLPRDGLAPAYSAIPQPSLVLFRYPSTISLQLLDSAIETPESSWASHVDTLESKIPGASVLKEMRPIKLGTLEPRFFADLLTRYVSLMIRLGAPSFDEPQVSKIVESIE